MRCLLAGLLSLAATAMLLGGIALMVVGGFNVYEDLQTYQVGFKRSGDRCGSEKVEIDVVSGEQLRCGPPGLRLPPGDPPSFPGFTAEQNDDVFSLVEHLRDGGLSEAEQQRIQRLVDSYAAHVPDNAQQRSEWWGARAFWLGLVSAACGAVGHLVLRRAA